MTGNNIKKLILNDFRQFALEYGYIKRKSNFWYCCSNGIMKAIGFEFKSSSASARYFVFPLYLDKYDYIVLEYGDAFERRYGPKYVLHYDSVDAYIMETYERIKAKFREYAIPKLSGIDTANDVLKECDKHDLFASQPINLMRLKAYSAAYVGQYELAIDLFNEYLKEKEKLTRYIDIREYDYPLFLKESPKMLEEKMEENVIFTLKANKLMYS